MNSVQIFATLKAVAERGNDIVLECEEKRRGKVVPRVIILRDNVARAWRDHKVPLGSVLFAIGALDEKGQIVAQQVISVSALCQQE